MISGKNLTKAYSDKKILSGVDILIGNGRKIGLVGKNGCGKTTLFRILNGIEDPSGGNIDIQNEIIGYIPQEFDFPDEMVGEYLEKRLESKWDTYKLEILAAQLKFSNYDPYQILTTLSEGQKMKVKLMEIFLSDPTVLFIDEPTNHLDIEGIMWFEDYVRSLPIAVVMISHDRSFLNHTVDEILEIDKQKIFRFVGDYDNYKEEKLKLINKWDQEYVLFLKKKQQLETLLENVRKIKDGKKRGRAVESVKKRIDREIVHNKKEKYVSKKIKELEFDTTVHTGKLMVRFDKVSKSYGDNNVFQDLSFELRGKEKIWLYGPNGAGKSTIVKILMNIEKPTTGEVTIGENIKIGYFSQVQSNLTSENEIMDEFIEKTGCYFGQAYGYLNKFLFDRDSVRKRVWQLSPGERARFAFAIFAYKNYDLLVLDEPDNHLDIETKEVLEKSLSEFNGTLLLVSHDRYFVEMVGVDKVLNLKEGKLTFFEEM
ncbi:ABC-F family ATP-binding cassette domain-containing protein [candidate division WWE3 bacterium]|uniref:ABC-F family ATP-binding cassette domain-containing protein n=1 Tax=candidate division WWE3 bacterium TaxID=2053526 RepID=A0A7X9DKX2_UNCKA|nr:ABC-F family ATP-binding cassette domain-containing protein [candidate division WWE3 bacterium]